MLANLIHPASEWKIWWIGGTMKWGISMEGTWSSRELYRNFTFILITNSLLDHCNKLYNLIFTLEDLSRLVTTRKWFGQKPLKLDAQHRGTTRLWGEILWGKMCCWCATTVQLVMCKVKRSIKLLKAGIDRNYTQSTGCMYYF